MNKQEYISYWVKTAEKDWEASQDLFSTKKFVHALFFAHLTLEKICKAHWIKDNENNFPPRIHNLIRILAETEMVFPDKDLQFLEEFNDFQMEGRYPDYLMKIYEVCNQSYTKSVLYKVNTIRECLLRNL